MFISKIKSKTLQDLLKVLSGNIVAQGVGFLTIIIISRDLGPEQYGIFSLLLAIFTVAVQISDFGVSTSYVKYVSENLSKAKEIFVTVILSKVALSLIIIVALYFLSGVISDFFFDSRKYQKLIELIAVAILFQSFFGVIVGHFQAIQNFKVFSYLNITHNLLKLLSVIIISFSFSQEKHLEYFMLSYAFVVIFLIFSISIKNYKLFSYIKQFDFNYFIQIYKLGFWVFLSSLLVVFMMRLDLFMLQKLMDSKAVGLFSVVLSVNSIYILILSSLTATLLPKVSEYLKSNSIQAYLDRLFSFKKYIILFTLFIILVSPMFIKLVFGSEYEDSILPFQILAISYFFSFYASPISLILINKNKAHLLSLMNLFQIIILFLTNLVLIPLVGLIGAAISLSLMRLFGFLFVYIYVKRNYV